MSDTTTRNETATAWAPYIAIIVTHRAFAGTVLANRHHPFTGPTVARRWLQPRGNNWRTFVRRAARRCFWAISAAARVRHGAQATIQTEPQRVALLLGFANLLIAERSLAA